MSLKYFLSQFALFLCFSADAAPITYVSSSELLAAMSHDVGAAWQLNDRACLEKPKDWDNEDAYIPECGWVVMATFRGAVVKFSERPDDLEIGREIKKGTEKIPGAMGKSESARREVENRHWQEMFPLYHLLLTGSADGDAGSEGESVAVVDTGAPASRSFTLGIGNNFFRAKAMGASNIAPQIGVQLIPSLISFQTALSGDSSVGLGVFYSTFTDGGIKGASMGVLGSYYSYFGRVFHGFNIQFAGGYSFTNNILEGENLKYYALHGLGAIGWRDGGSINYGVAVGGQVLYASSFVGQNGGFILFLPSASFDVSWNF